MVLYESEGRVMATFHQGHCAYSFNFLFTTIFEYETNGPIYTKCFLSPSFLKNKAGGVLYLFYHQQIKLKDQKKI